MRFGVESGSERLRKDILDRQTPESAIYRVFNIARKFNVMPSSYNMIGIPTETQEEVLETLRLNARLSADVIKIMTFYPFHGTRLYNFCIEKDLIDFKKKEELDNYDSGTCLKFSPEHQLFLEKTQVIFPWYLNVFSSYDPFGLYQKAIADVVNMAQEEWGKFNYTEVTDYIDKKMEGQEFSFYKTHFNGSIAIKVPTFWERSSLQRQHEIAHPGNQME